MSYAEIQTGAVIRYPYLWAAQARMGETEGRKTRPVAVAVRLRRNKGLDTIILLPVTSKQPDSTRFSREIPQTEKRRAGLDVDLRIWIVLDEYNLDTVGTSFYLEPDPPLGMFSKAFFLPLMREFIVRRQEFKGVNRRL